ncbi:DUF1841 family protein [Kribbella sp. NPDC058245]|uniref:DUF1841 family protein n=1 Tax=Kribbella sp. NPDC058245 TaxID=3346399 RepID=UPI0036ED3160
MARPVPVDGDEETERRLFAMPYVDAQIGDEDFVGLDPDSEDERSLLIQGEHPEYQDALADPGFKGEVDGANPRLHIAIHEVVANQLWNNDPPEVWETARKLRDRGEDRHDILHAIGALVVEHIHAGLVGREHFDIDRYRAKLDQLSRDGIT